jgi:predicted MFS family arabinose efflux permease
MMTSYRRVLSLPGALAFSLSGLVARLPISMVSLGVVLLVSTRTGSYATAGGVSAAFVIATSVFSVVQGRLFDRLGQSVVLPPAVLLFAGSLTLLMVAVEWDWGTPAAVGFAALAGAAQPQIGSCVRARWSHIVPERAWVQTAYAFEAVVDESVFMVGPTVVTLLATGVHPLAGLSVAVLAALVGTFALVAQRRTEPPPHPRNPVRTERPRLPWRTLGPLTAAAAAMGALFGATEVATVAFSEELGAKAASGPLLAVWALGSLLSGVITGTITWRAHTASRFRGGALLLGLSMLPLPWVGGFPVMVGVLFVAGFAISPTLIAMTAWVEEVVPVSRLTESMAVIGTGITAGVAPGALVAGTLIDAGGSAAGYWVSVASGALGFAAALVAHRSRPGRVTPAAASPTG